MANERNPGRTTGSLAPEIQVLLSMLAAAVLMTVIAVVAVTVTGGLPPRLTLQGPTWQWTGSTTPAGEATTVVADPAAYAIRFARDWTFAAGADCNEVTGTYGVVPAGRAGGATNHLTIEPGAVTLAACGAGSLADQFVDQLRTASTYAIAGTRLTISLAPRGTMTFEAAPGDGASPVP